ncbi:uncharacterized protein N7483_003906 [Penicillium malachiteum]|uniref:uncharacterized protein n=1 Tax=Penicillium malachiteum TaxID=1324776 RepID=UPI002547FD4F|nr:uncharacterized protein N7483_003906 [Penicillium malachiteum]KAJ5729398.1 hypothetical protein N7483_003906 [Penicillium malachiteum]
MAATDARTVLSHDDYTVGWICALPLEIAAAELMLDTIHPRLVNPPTYQNTYTLGNIGEHNIVIACLTTYGIAPAAVAATRLLATFHSIRFGLMVGIGGGVPSSNVDIRLGDIVFSCLEGTSGGVIQYDFGKSLHDGRFQRTGMLNQPPIVLLGALATLRAHHLTKKSQVLQFTSDIHAKTEEHYLAARFDHPVQEDYLYEAEYDHGESDTCVDCDPLKRIARPSRDYQGPLIHYGLIASANRVMKDGQMRYQMAQELKVCCVEMEAAGLMNDFPCIVIRGICDYADSHKNKEWQGFAAAVAAAYAKELLLVVPIQEIEKTPKARDTLYFNPINTTQKVAILHGLGGIGKTQLAVHFVREHKHDFTAIFWLNAKNGNSRWLIVFDNIDQYDPNDPGDGNLYDIKKFFPSVDHGSILITSRLLMLTELGKPFPIRKLGLEDTAQVFMKNIDLSGDNTTGGLESSPDVILLAGRLYGLPLAIVIAAAFMRETGTSITQYLTYYQQSWPDLQSQSSPGGQYQQGNILHTWMISYNEIQNRDPDAAELLLLLAHFDNRDIWYELVENASKSSDVPAWLERAISSELAFKARVKSLIEFSFLETKQQGGSYTMHPVVQDWCLYITSSLRRRTLNPVHHLELAIISVGASVPTRREGNFTKLHQRLIPHANLLRISQESLQMDQFSTNNIAVWDSFNAIGLLYKDEGKLKEAYEMLQRALAGKEKAHGPDHISTLKTVGNLAILYKKQGNITKSEETYLQALSGIERICGPESRSTLITLNNLGTLYYHQGKVKEAERMLLRALAGKENSYGPENIRTLDTVKSLGMVYSNQGKLKEAEELYMRALAGYNKDPSRGPEHLFTLDTILELGVLERDQGKRNCLEGLYQKQGKPREAEKAYQQALAIFEKTPGSEDESTLHAVHLLGLFYKNQGRLQEAEEMFRRALVGREKILGLDHKSTLKVALSIGNLYSSQGRLREAEEIYQRVLVACFEQPVIQDYLSILNRLHNLGSLYVDQGNLKEAEHIYQRALAGYEKALGLDYTSTLKVVLSLGHLYSNQGKLREAEEIYQRVLVACSEKAINPEYSSILGAASNLGALFVDQGKPKEAEEVFQRTLAGYGKALGPDHQYTLVASRNLVVLYFMQGRQREWEDMCQNVLAAYERVMGPDHHETQALLK